MVKRRYSRRRPRRSRKTFYRKRRYGRKNYKKSRFGKRRKNGALSKLFKAILPSLPVKNCGALGMVGRYGGRSWTQSIVGDVASAYALRDALPGQSNIFDDGSIGTSTHMTFQQYAAKKYKLKHTKNVIGQNLGNTHMIMTIYFCKFRHDYQNTDAVTYDKVLSDTSTTANSGQDLLEYGSALTGAGAIEKYYEYPQYTPFMSNEFVTTFKVVKSRKLRIGPSEWFKFKISTGYKEFDKKWLLQNDAEALPIKYLRGWSTVAYITYHGEAVTDPTDVNLVTLSKNDLMLYWNETKMLKAVPHHRKCTRLAVPSGLTTLANPAATPLVRPSGVVQVTETSHAAQSA